MRIWYFIPTLAWERLIFTFWPPLGGLLIWDLQQFLRGYENFSTNQIWLKFTLMQSRLLLCIKMKWKYLIKLQSYGHRKWWKNNDPRLCNRLLNFLYKYVNVINEWHDSIVLFQWYFRLFDLNESIMVINQLEKLIQLTTIGHLFLKKSIITIT